MAEEIKKAGERLRDLIAKLEQCNKTIAELKHFVSASSLKILEGGSINQPAGGSTIAEETRSSEEIKRAEERIRDLIAKQEQCEKIIAELKDLLSAFSLKILEGGSLNQPVGGSTMAKETRSSEEIKKAEERMRNLIAKQEQCEKIIAELKDLLSALCLKILEGGSINQPVGGSTMAEETRSSEEIDKAEERIRDLITKQEQCEEIIAELKDLLSALSLKIPEGGSINQPAGGYRMPTSIKFPKFSRKDLKGWLYKCEQFFDLDSTPVEARLKLIALCLEGRFLRWHMRYMKMSSSEPTWEEYTEAFNARFVGLKKMEHDSELQDYVPRETRKRRRTTDRTN